MPWVRAAVRSCTAPGQCVRGPDQVPGGIGEDLHVHPVVLLLPGVVRPVGGDAVDRQHGAVEDHVRLLPVLPDCRHGLFQRGREGGQEVDGLAYVPVDRRDPDAETCRKAGVGVAAVQVGQDEPGLPTAGQATPPGADLTAVTCEKTGEVLQGAAGPIDAGRVDKHAKAPGGLVILIVNPSTRGFLHVRCRGRPSSLPSGWKQLTDCESISAAVGSVSRLVAWRILPRNPVQTVLASCDGRR